MDEHDQIVEKRDAQFEAPLAFTPWRDPFADGDHCVFGIEGMDELARFKGVYDKVSRITKLGMKGAMPWGLGFRIRLGMVNPTLDDIEILTGLYRASVTPFAKETIEAAKAVGVHFHLFSGGIRQAIAPVAEEIGIARDNVHAIRLIFDDHGLCIGFDENTPLASGRKDLLIEELRSKGRVDGSLAAIDDGEMGIRAVGNGLRVGFGAYSARPEVQDIADVFIARRSFAAILPLVIGRVGVETLMSNHPETREVLTTGIVELGEACFGPRAARIQNEILTIRRQLE